MDREVKLRTDRCCVASCYGASQTAASTIRYEGSSRRFEGSGLAALDKETGKVMLVQVADCQTYVKTLHQMHIHNPYLVLIPDTFLSASDAALAPSGKRAVSTSLLVEYIREEFPGVQIEPVGRRYWNDAGGLEFVLQLCVEDDERAGTILAVSSKYYAMSAVCALFKYAESRLNTRFAAASLRIRYIPVDGTMMIDPDTARNLELVGNMTHKKSIHSLFGVLNHTYTPMASRLLRINILSPLTVQGSIEARLDVVEELINKEDLFTYVRDALKTLNKMDFDKLIAALASSEAKVTTSARPASQRVLQVLNLRNVVKNLPVLRKALEGSQSQLLQIVYHVLALPKVVLVGGLAAVNARVYAVKANCNRLLDVARETYKENIGDIYQLNRTLSEEHDLPLSLVYQETGFVFALKKNELEGELPKGFVNVSLKKGRWMFSSMELKKMNARMKDALDETLILSDKIVQDLIAEIVADIGALYKASEAVALVDMLWSFAHASIIRPEFTGTLAIKSGRHPVLEIVQSAGTLVPNDVYCDDSSAFQMVQGPNTYLRQVGLLTVMALCGCFVPVEYASFRIHDFLLSRLSNDDDLEKSLSTFASEMASCAMILGLASPKSLVLGVGIAHAIAEALIALKVRAYILTAIMLQRSRSSTNNFGMSFQYKIVDGAAEDFNHYGLQLAKLADLPSDVLVEAKRVADILTDLQTKHEESSEGYRIATRRKALLRLRTQLVQAYEHSALPDQDLLEYIGRFQTDIAKAFLHG
ncbi:DNA mismatch repair protein MutS [Gymnopilus junonius]|uniref:DNA mismatch repair protein MutS n=1 Tax=Gymnopilus junonius TaxID=109634 RepID=A0A9P5NHI9_GYMJU|nr:DNA mismatch repair protein MutS [Gymnopilus junonius]